MMKRVRSETEKGATAVLITASMLLLLGFAAIAIDVSDAKDERRLDQSAVDVATLGGGVELIVSGGLQATVDEIKSLVDTNLGRNISSTSAWTDCTDSQALEVPSDTIPGVTGGSNCISFGSNDDGIAFARIRVRLPDQDTPASFSRILGTTSLQTSAAAVVVLDGVGNFGTFPASVFSGAGAGDEFCVKDGTGTAGSETCENATTGDFGNFQPYFYTDVDSSNTDTTCTSGNQTAPLSWVMANGIDHFLGFTESAPGNRVNGDDCPQSPGPAFPNRVDSGSGYSNADITEGLILGGSYADGFDGRLTKKTWPSSEGYEPFTIFGEEVDNRPLWTYIEPSVAAAAATPSACTDAATGPKFYDGTNVPETDFTQAQQDIRDCLAHPDVPENLFTAELYESPRLTIVPMFHQTTPLGNNSCCYDIKDYVPVFLESIWTDNGAQWTCSDGVVDDEPEDFCRHDPGRSGEISISAAGQQKVNSMSGIVLSCDVLGPPGDGEEKCRRVGSGGSPTTVFANLFLDE